MLLPIHTFRLVAKQALGFTCLKYKSFEKTVGKGEFAHKEQFFLFPQCFPPNWRTFWHLHQIYNCRLQTLSVWKSLKFVVWEWVKYTSKVTKIDKYCRK